MPAPQNADFRKALLLAILVPAALWGGAAIVAERVFGLPPCEMCYWQRWPHMAALALGLIAWLVRDKPIARPLVLLAGLAILVSGLIGLFHAGVEYGWWEGLTRCTASIGSGGSGNIMDDIMGAPLVRCDVPAWTLMGISLAGFNAIFSIASATAIFIFLGRGKRKS